MHRNALLHILADVERRIAFCEAELAYRRARLDRVGQATREAIDAIAGNSASGARAQTWADPPLAFVVALGHRDLVAKVPRGTGILKIGKTLGIGTSSRALSGSPQAREG